MGRCLTWPPGGAWAGGSGLGAGHHQRQDEADAALAILRAEIPDYDRHVAGGEMARVGVAGHHGGDRRSEQGNNVTLAKPIRGNSKTYLISRLKRDAADPACPWRTQAHHWLKRLEEGAVSTRQASLAMGYVKPVASIPTSTALVARIKPQGPRT